MNILERHKSLFLDFPEYYAVGEIQLCLKQAHLFAKWDTLGVNDHAKISQLKGLYELHQKYPLEEYISKCRSFLLNASKNVNIFDGQTPFPPSAEDQFYYNVQQLSDTSSESYKLEEDGSQQLDKCLFVLVAGGLGERLGSNHIKVAQSHDPFEWVPFLELYCACIRAIHAVATVKFPLFIMTSEETHTGTEEQLQRMNYYGLEKEYIILLQQDCVLAVSDINASIALDPVDKYKVLVKPHGHGDIHLLLHRLNEQTGIQNTYLTQGAQYLFFLQDTNPFSFRGLAAMIGLARARDWIMTTLVVPRSPGDSVGALARLCDQDGQMLPQCNVEYNQQSQQFHSTTEPVLYPLDDSEESKTVITSAYPGNTNVQLLNLSRYIALQNQSRGHVSEFVNPKIQPDGTFSPCRLECMMQDLPKHFDATKDRVGAQYFPQWLGFSPLKNSCQDGISQTLRGLAPQCVVSLDADVLKWVVRLLQSTKKMKVTTKLEGRQLQGIHMPDGPYILTDAAQGITPSRIVDRLNNLQITQESVQSLQGDITIHSLQQDGTLTVIAEEGSKVQLERFTQFNSPCKFTSVSVDSLACPNSAVCVCKESLRMRGYKLHGEGHTCYRVPCMEGTPVLVLSDDNKHLYRVDRVSRACPCGLSCDCTK